MSPGMVGRIREDRRVRRDFNELIEANYRVPDSALRGERKPRPPLLQRGWRWWAPRALVIVLAFLVLVTGAVLLEPLPFDPPAPLQTAFVYDRDGRLITRLDPGEDRVVVPLRRIPRVLRRAVLAAEDERFYRHGGVDAVAIVRAGWKNLTGGRFQGASTITQQLVRNTSSPSLQDPTPGYVGRERSMWRKVKEAVLAVRFERRFSKNEILEMYLNQIYFGHGAYGVEAAARTYFDRHVWQLRLPEAATLAGIIASPERASPRLHPDRARARRDFVLERMAELGFIRPARAERAMERGLRVAEPAPETSRAAHFVDYLRRDISRRFGDDLLYRGGLRIETTLDLDLQRAAERAVGQVLNQRGDPEAALVAIDVRTGGILAMVGGRSFKRSQVNLATGQGGSGRQSGSAFKPFVLAQALEEGFSEHRAYRAPGTLSLPGWQVSNYGGSSYGTLSLRSATTRSVNTVFAQLIMDVGPEDVATLARRMGIRSELHPVGSLALGTSEVTPLEMTAGYATLASGGRYRRPTGVERLIDSSGDRTTVLRGGNGKQVVSADVAARVTGMLQDVVSSGTGTAARISGTRVAGKTGTTNDHADAWFCGYTADVAACVWVGYPMGRVPMRSVHGIPVTGGSFPALIWRAFMSGLSAPGAPGGATSAGGGGSQPTEDQAPAGDDREGTGGQGRDEEPPPPREPPDDDDGGILPPVIPPPG